MKIVGKIIGGGIGAALGGPLGALIGAGIGHAFVDSAQNINPKKTYTQNEKVQVAYFTCFFACIGKIAKADGTFSQSEVDSIDELINQELQLNNKEKNLALNILKEVEYDEKDAGEYIQQLAKIVNYDKEICEAFLRSFYKVAISDNNLHPEEEKILYESEKIFRLNKGTVDSIIGKQQGTMGLEEAHNVLNTNSGMSNEEIKKQYRKKCMDFHPDKLVNKGLPEEFIKFSNEQMIKIQEAYKTVCKSRNI